MKRAEHLVDAVDYSEGVITCRCGWSSVDPSRTYLETRDLFTEHRKSFGLKSEDSTIHATGEVFARRIVRPPR